jgi:hypothetical protein
MPNAMPSPSAMPAPTSMPYATGAMPYADGGVVDDALRLANQGKYRLHQTIARHGYATDGEVKPEEPQVEAYGEVEFAPEYMPRPTEQIQQPNEASSQAFIHEGLKGSAPQYDPTVERGIGHGLTAAAKWTPPGAVADAAGLLGGPSLYQNVKEGRYMPAALQVASVGLPAALAGRAAIAAGLGAGASKFTKLGKPDAYGMPGYIGYQTAEDWGPGVLGKETYEGAKKAGKAALEKGTSYIKSKFGYADGGEVEDALRLARSRQGYATDGGVPDEGGQREFLKESLKDSAPQYVESQDFPARAERAVQSVDKTAGAANNLLAKAFSVPEARSPEGRSAKEIVESAIPQDPNQISKQAMQQWQSGDKVGAVETMAGGMPQTGAIRAYHGSPHKFDKFDINQIGTGEGAQAYGHGLYFAGNEDVAKSYKDALAHKGAIDIEHEASKRGIPLSREGRIELMRQARGVEDPFQAAKQLQWANSEARNVDVNSLAELIKARQDSLKGHMYEVDLNVHPDRMLQYDRPVSEQHPNIERRLNTIFPFGSNKSGESVLRELEKLDATKRLSDRGQISIPAAASERLLDAGIPGVRYLDEGSRHAGEGTSNYVMFTDKPINVLRRYAKGGDVENAIRLAKGGSTPAWTRAEGKDPAGGLNAKGRASAKAQGMNLKPPAPHPKTEKDAKRRKSFCARMSGNPGPMKDEKGRPTRKALSLKAWNCADGGAVEDAIRLASGGEVWEKPRPKSLGKPKHLSESQKASAKASAKAAGRPYPNWVDNANAAKRGK